MSVIEDVAEYSSADGEKVPEPGQQVMLRGHPWVVKGVRRSTLPPPSTRPDSYKPTHLITLVSLDDDRWEYEIDVIWELEPGRRIYERANLPTPSPDRIDDPETLGAFLDAVRWAAVTNADAEALQAPFRSGITIEDYQLEPLVRALRMPRANLLIADDVGLGKTIEAGLVIQELILRHRVRTAMIICPAPLQKKWQDEMAEKFGLHFEIIDTAYVKELRRKRGVRANPWTSYPRLITSLDWVKTERPLHLLRNILPAEHTYPRAFDLLVIDEVHNVAPSATGKYATDSQRTAAIRELVPHFEHRLFLSATPHNGYEESWTALLELLDSQRFARGVKPDPMVRDQVVIRRLKSQFIDDVPHGETPRFPRRQIEPIPVTYTDEERQAHADLQAYVRLRQGGSDRSRQAGDFVHKLLKKRLFSSPRAFANTLSTHIDTVTAASSGDLDESGEEGHLNHGHAKSGPSAKALRSVLTKAEDEFSTDDDRDQAEQDALRLAAKSVNPLTAEQRQVLARLTSWANKAADRSDAKTATLINWLTDIVKPGGKWSNERVIIFTEYRDTQQYLIDQLTANGLTQGGRTRTLYGGQDSDEREAIKAAFQAEPHLDAVRILVATDTASEGIDLQRQCHRLVHSEIPWNPNRMEQRNGRIDRHGQTNPTADIFHFVGAGYEQAEPGSLEGDLEFLSKAASKVDRIRNDLGSAGPVIADQVEQAMLGKRSRFDEATIDATVNARTKLAATERRLREKVRELADRVVESRTQLGLSPQRLQRAVAVALELDQQPALRPDTLERGGATHPVWRIPALDHGWRRINEQGRKRYGTDERVPVTFDHDLAAGADDVDLIHLGHPLVDKALAMLRSEIWVEDNPRLARVSTAIVPDDLLPSDDGAVVAYGRLVITGATGARLHEDLITAGGRVRNGNWSPLNVEEMGQLVNAMEPQTVAPALVATITDHWPQLADRVQTALRRRRADVANGLVRTFQTRADRDAEAVAQILNELKAGIEALFVSPEYEQLSLDLQTSGSDAERAQLRFDEQALRRRLEEIPAEIERDTAAVRQRYDHPQPRMFPAALTLVFPQRKVVGQ